nr:hypothetical protein [uncultured Methanoregula sp.]
MYFTKTFLFQQKERFLDTDVGGEPADAPGSHDPVAGDSGGGGQSILFWREGYGIFNSPEIGSAIIMMPDMGVLIPRSFSYPGKKFFQVTSIHPIYVFSLKSLHVFSLITPV